jgi:hypothetical protein
VVGAFARAGSAPPSLTFLKGLQGSCGELSGYSETGARPGDQDPSARLVGDLVGISCAHIQPSVGSCRGASSGIHSVVQAARARPPRAQ